MTDKQKENIAALRGQGYGYATIAASVGVKKDAVVAYCRKCGLTGTRAESNSRITADAVFCPNCGSVVTQTVGRKPRRFCSDRCRMDWWNTHPEEVRRKAIYTFVCAACGKPFTAYGNNHRKYCSHQCYIVDRFQGGEYHA